MNKNIQRENTQSTKIFDHRSLANDYRTLVPLLKKGMRVLDVGCGTGAITKDIANAIGPEGSITGIDNTKSFIESGQSTYATVSNMQLLHADIFKFEPEDRFDLIVSARVLQWLSNPLEALLKMKTLLRPDGILSILDYNHTKIEWAPAIPHSMRQFYDTFLKWRSNAGMDNEIADHLPELMATAGFHSIEVFNSDEYYDRSRTDFQAKTGIWSKVAGSSQMVEEGYLDDDLRLLAIREYDAWVEREAVSMTMKLKEVRGVR